MRKIFMRSILVILFIQAAGCSPAPKWTASDLSVIETKEVQGTAGYGMEAANGFKYVAVRGVFNRAENVSGEMQLEDIALLTEHQVTGSTKESEWPLEGIMASINNNACSNYFLLSSYITANSTVSNMDGEEYLSLRKEGEHDTFHMAFKKNPLFLCLLFHVEDIDYTTLRLRLGETTIELGAVE